MGLPGDFRVDGFLGDCFFRDGDFERERLLPGDTFRLLGEEDLARNRPFF